MKKIKNIVFDFGGVICVSKIERCIEAFEEIGLKDAHKYLDAYAQTGLFGDLENGTVSDIEYMQELSKLVRREVSWQECQHAWHCFVAEVPERNLDALLKLRGQGYNLALLSNTNPFVASWFRSSEFDGKGHGLDYYIPNLYLSFEQKVMKPDVRIFQHMLVSEGFNSEETLFVDDSPINIEAAKKVGLITFQPQNGEYWENRLQAFLNA